MNVHHLELFYYVARHGGIMPAVRNIPYGIQQPAVSAQVAQLEEFLGVTLFQRRPFSLTPPGRSCMPSSSRSFPISKKGPAPCKEASPASSASAPRPLC